MTCRCMNLESFEKNNDESSDVFTRLIKERIVFLCEEIDAAVATSTAATLFLLDIKDSEKEITLYINSNGGSVPDGLLTIYDTLQFIKAPIKTVCIGQAYSSAAIILTAGSKGRRYAYPNSKIMIHSLQIEDMSGTEREIQEEAKRIRKENHVLNNIISKHTGQSIKKVQRDCEKDKYFTPAEAIKYGLIDYIVEPAKKIIPSE